LSFSYIWYTAFTDDYLQDLPADGEVRTQILVSGRDSEETQDSIENLMLTFDLIEKQ
jgi:hypothetical protein